MTRFVVFGMSGIPRIRPPLLRIPDRSKALNNVGSLARMLTSEEATRPI
jgi:hypothetical protein